MKFLALLFGLVFLISAGARAQVTVNPAALQQLAGFSAPASVAPSTKLPNASLHVKMHTAYRPAGNRIKIVRRVGFVVLKPSGKPLPPKPHLALAPVPAAARVPAPRKLEAANVVFAAGSATLPAGAAVAIRPYCGATGSIDISARAPGDPSDPSIAMRLSLARAMAVRDALTACGVPSANIIPRAMGSVPGGDDNVTQLAPAP